MQSKPLMPICALCLRKSIKDIDVISSVAKDLLPAALCHTQKNLRRKLLRMTFFCLRFRLTVISSAARDLLPAALCHTQKILRRKLLRMTCFVRFRLTVISSASERSPAGSIVPHSEDPSS